LSVTSRGLRSFISAHQHLWTSARLNISGNLSSPSSATCLPMFVQSPLFADQGIDFFSSNVELGPNGIEKIHPIGELSAEEKKLLEACLPELKKNIEKTRLSLHR
ncbi:hypothetical protein B0H13DRAFT_2412418, partial [Mycena leptocephala]